MPRLTDQNGKFLERLTQFSGPSGIAMNENDTICVADSESESVRASITEGSARQSIAIDSKDVIYGGEVVPNDSKKYVKQ